MPSTWAEDNAAKVVLSIWENGRLCGASRTNSKSRKKRGNGPVQRSAQARVAGKVLQVAWVTIGTTSTGERTLIRRYGRVHRSWQGQELIEITWLEADQHHVGKKDQARWLAITGFSAVGWISLPGSHRFFWPLKGRPK